MTFSAEGHSFHRQPPLASRAYAVILAGGRGSRLHNLTDRRAKPAVYFGGKFRIVDFVLSNCLNSGLRRIGVMTQYKSHSLLRHLQRGWNFLRPELNEFIDLLPAQQRVDEVNWYRGTGDAVFQNIDILKAHAPEYIVILAGDHVYKMDYAAMLRQHVARGAPCTVACIEAPLSDATGFGVMSVGEGDRITAFVEKPAHPQPMPGRDDRALCSMGIYVFDARYLYDALASDMADPTSAHDFGRDIIPKAVADGLAVAHRFRQSAVNTTPDGEPYWRDIGTVDAYYEANIDLTLPQPSLDLYDRSWPIVTHQEQLPPAKFVFDDDQRRGTAVDSLVSGGCIVSGASVRRSVLYSSCRVNSWATLDGAVLLPHVHVGRHARLTKVIVDRGCVIPPGLVIGEDADFDAKHFHRSSGGVTLVWQDALDRLANGA